MADDDYQYDVFFSYRRDPLIQDWIMEVVTRLRFRLTQDLGGDQARIFWDRDIEVGDIWPEAARCCSEIQMFGACLVTQLLSIGVVLVGVAELSGTREALRCLSSLDRAG